MKILNDYLEIQVNKKGTIDFIKHDDMDILHDGDQWWQKIFPMIWPNLSFSTGFVYEKKEFTLPKHGFWGELDWDIIRDKGKLTLLGTHFENDLYPFTIDIQKDIEIEENMVHIRTKFSNLSSKTAYFHFGLHPAFKIDKKTVLETDAKDLRIIDKQGKLQGEYNIENTPLMDVPFGKDFDTLVYKKGQGSVFTIVTGKKKLSMFSNAKATQIWKPADAEFVCIEPWYGVNDQEYDAPNEVEKKQDIIALEKGKSWYSTFTFQIDDVEVKN